MKTVKRSLLFAVLVYTIGCASLRQGDVQKQNVIQSEAIQQDYPSFEIQPLDDEAKIYKTLNGVYISSDVVHFDDEKETQNVEQIQLKSETHETNQQFIVYEDPINWNDQGTQEIQDAQVYEDKTMQMSEQDEFEQDNSFQEQKQEIQQNVDEEKFLSQQPDQQDLQLMHSDMELQPNDNKITIELPNNIINDKTIKLQAKLEVSNDITQIKELINQQKDDPLIKQIIQQQNNEEVEFDDSLFDQKPIVATKIIAEYTLTQVNNDEGQQLNQQEGEEQEPEQEQAPDEAPDDAEKAQEEEEKPIKKKKKKKKKSKTPAAAAGEDGQPQEDGEQQAQKKKKKKKKKKPKQTEEPKDEEPKDEDKPRDDEQQVAQDDGGGGGECKVIKHEHHHYHHYDKKKEEEKAEREAEGGEEKADEQGEEKQEEEKKDEEQNEDKKTCKPKGKKGKDGKDKSKKNKSKKKKADDEEDGGNGGEDAEGGDDQEDWSKEKKKKLKQKQPIYDEYGRYIRNHPYINQKDHYRYYPYYRYNDYHKFRPDYYYRHRWTYPDHYPFHHTHPYHKFHPYDQYDCFQCPESLGKFYPDLTGQGKITQAYKGRYTNPEQVLKDIVTRRRQNAFYRQYMQPERISTGYFHNMGQANIQQDLQDCFTVYNECGYKGASLTLCGESPDIKNSFQIFSYKIPNDLTVKFFKSQNEAIDVEGSNECLEIPYELI